ncbi:mechanosensitive ion channel family protein [Fulvivirga lutea]|uniref:Mechanosensitive ion channel n=1 Tax=Fulvivirga lutea TaxID=2810512 RepID=A0A975A2D0_9BACT|nr:mechanosensitive ion channel domain-containing protein [Fulvivirga lutea]QSE99160.1 mechanosensitive ion channel [Fulvivirga lutea]
MLERLKISALGYWDSLIELLPDLILASIWLIMFTVIGMLLRSIIRKRLLRNSNDPLIRNFIGRIVLLLMIIFGVIIFLNQIGLGNAAGGLLAGAGVSAIILGFAFKDIGENFLAGFFLAFSRPFKIGDVIEIQNLQGTVNSLSFRNTHIRTFDGKDIYIPNATLIKQPLINYTRDGLQRFDFLVGIAYEENILAVTQLISQTLDKIEEIKHDTDLSPFLELEAFGSSTVNIRIYYWINSYNFTEPLAILKTKVMYEILKALSDNEINLPATITEVKIYEDQKSIPLIIKNSSEDKVD